MVEHTTTNHSQYATNSDRLSPFGACCRTIISGGSRGWTVGGGGGGPRPVGSKTACTCACKIQPHSFLHVLL